MRRKVIKQGHNTLTITLPNKWVKNFNLQAGNEVEILEKENGLFITTEKNTSKKSATLDISGLDIPVLWKYFMAIYREGYDEVIVKFDKNERYDSPYKFFSSHSIDMKYERPSRKHTPFETVQEITNRFIGFEVVEHHADHCVIKDMLQATSKEFDSSLRRVFLLLQQMGEEMLEAIKTNNVEIVSHTHDIDINVDKFNDYCIRILKKTELKEIKKSDILFSILYILELIGDEFKNIAHHLLSDLKSKNLANLLQLAELIIEQLNKFYELFYNFKKEKIIEISRKDMEVYFYLPKLYKKKPGKKSTLSDDELEVFNHFRRISKYINAVTELRIEMEF